MGITNQAKTLLQVHQGLERADTEIQVITQNQRTLGGQDDLPGPVTLVSMVTLFQWSLMH